MVVRKRRKKNKLRGQRTHGAGNTKNRRGAGSRGGVGKAGSHKHKFSKYYVEFGTKRKLKAKEKGETITLTRLDSKIPEWVEKGIVKKEGELIVVDGKEIGFDKILSNGKISHKIKPINIGLTKKAEEKIIQAGGNTGELEGEAEAE